MLLGGSLNPDYFTDRVNLFVALAPVGSIANCPEEGIRHAAAHIKEIETLVVDVLKIYNWVGPKPNLVRGAVFLCDMPFIRKACDEIINMLFTAGIDDPKAAETLISNEPSGASWKTFAYYG
jgi:hypothetical protein